MECLSESATKDLVNLLVSRGYFHVNVTPELANEDNKSKNDISKHSEKDDACQIVSTQDGKVMTKDLLQEQLMEMLSSAGGRLSIEDASTLLAVDSCHVKQISNNIDAIIQVGEDLIIELYMDRMAETTKLQLDKNSGRVFVSELATCVWEMPIDLVMNALQQRIASGKIQASLLTISSHKVLVTPAFEEREKCRIQGAFRAITLPTQVDSVCQDFEWDIAYVLPILKDACQNGHVLGELHDSGGSLAGAMYIPNVFLDMQRRSVDESFLSNGYITAQECLVMGVLESKMGDYVQKTSPSAIVLSSCVILKEVVVSPIEQALLETIASDSFLDLRLHLPDAIMQYEEDVRIIVEEMALPKEETGRTVFSDGEALFVSQGMIRHITKTLLPPLIESFAKTRAKEIKLSHTLNDSNDKESPVIQSPKRKGRKSSKKANTAASKGSNETVQYAVVPLVTVANAVASEYPDLKDIQTAVSPLVDEKDDNVFWEQDEVSDSEAKVCGGPLYELCRSVLYHDSFQSSCELAVRAEVERLDSISHSSSVRSRKDGATRMRSIESAFEDSACFGAACFAVQAHAKFLQYAETVPDVDEDIILDFREDYLAGCCSDFTGRITEYCLFRNEIDDQVFIVERNKHGIATDAVESDLPEYCQPVDITARRYPTTKLVCVENTDSGEPKMPLPTLRVVLSGGVGVQLSRTWALCGGRCYEGGIKVNEDGSEAVRQGDPDGFLSHVEENCLTICGLPFKKLDKKSEKQYLFTRRKALTEQLEATNDPNEVLELTIMLLFQQVKSLVVSGPLLTGAILTLLQKERKISDSISKLLQDLANTVSGDSKPSGALLTAVKACGLSRDISKHTLTTFEVTDS